MARLQINQLELIETLLNSTYKDDSNVLIEKDTLNDGSKFEMKRIIVAHRLAFLMYKFDPNKTKLFPYFNEVSGIKQICDYILFVQEQNYLYVLLIELKKGLESAGNQLNASDAFVDFILNSARRVGINITENTKTIKIRISERRASNRNRTTKPKKLSYDSNGILNYDHLKDFRLKEIFEVENI